MTDLKKAAQKLVEKQKIAYISTLSQDGYPNTKAMLAPRKHENFKVFYFTTNTSSMRVRQIRENNKGCIYFSDNLFFKGVMFTGHFEVLEDSASKEMIWKKGDTMYYPKGVTDPDYCVLKFTALKGRIYSNLSTNDFSVDE